MQIQNCLIHRVDQPWQRHPNSSTRSISSWCAKLSTLTTSSCSRVFVSGRALEHGHRLHDYPHTVPVLPSRSIVVTSGEPGTTALSPVRDRRADGGAAAGETVAGALVAWPMGPDGHPLKPFPPSGAALESRTATPVSVGFQPIGLSRAGVTATRCASWRYGYRRVRLLRANLASRPPRALLPVRGQWPDLRSGLDAHAAPAVRRHRPGREHGPGVLHGGPGAGEFLGRPPRRSTPSRPPPLRRARGRDRRERDRRCRWRSGR